MNVKPTNRQGEVLLKVDRRDEALLAAANGARPKSPFAIKRILVPIDFSVCSKKALHYAIPLAKEHGAALTLLYVVPTPSYVIGEYGIELHMEAESQRAKGARKLARLEVNEVKSEVPAEVRVYIGSAAHQIVDAAKSLPADIIVISTHGRTGFKHVLLGSVAEYVVRHAPCPVLVVREREHEFLTS